MVGFVNVLEEIVFKEIYTQIEELRPEIQPKVKVEEVLAYAINRLPPLFATSMVGWQYQYNYALNQLESQILQLVKYGIKTVLVGDPLHDLTPLPNHLFINSAGILYQLSKLFDRRYLRWRDVPILVKELSSKSPSLLRINSPQVQDDTVIQFLEEPEVPVISRLSNTQRTLLAHSKRHMQKQLEQKKLAQETSYLQGIKVDETSWANDIKLLDSISIEQRALESYTLRAKLGLVNVLEHLVLLALERITTPELYAKINQSEVVSYALNRLPHMYATSSRGFKYLRQRAVTEYARDIISAVRNGVMKVAKYSRTDVVPIYTYQFEQEYEQSMLDLNSFFNRDDISFHNIMEISRDLLLANSALC
ncbi:MAG: late competence development ComFB family protein [Pseudanabaena sp. CAN_BIN31]|nr:late competence development ComFB family protein [Pseudanabaena sp. CAN_BIN31]